MLSTFCILTIIFPARIGKSMPRGRKKHSLQMKELFLFFFFLKDALGHHFQKLSWATEKLGIGGLHQMPSSSVAQVSELHHLFTVWFDRHTHEESQIIRHTFYDAFIQVSIASHLQSSTSESTLRVHN